MSEIARRVQRKFGRWAQGGGRTRRRIYYRLFSDAFQREEDSVDAGIHSYKGEIGSGRELFLVRRNTHMIEKGLTMRPRRAEFALDYIQQTVASFEAILTDSQLEVPGSELHWMLSVLREYFEATASSENPAIAASRRRFAELTTHFDHEVFTFGPHNPEPSKAVDIDDLISLAQSRRSVRWFLPDPVPREKVEKALEVAIEAPTACNRQPYRFEIFDEPESVAKVAAIPMGTKGYAQQIPGIIVIIGDLSAFFDERDRHLIYIDSCLAAMGLVHGLEAQGIGSCCINWPDMASREKAMRELLGLKTHERVIMLVAYGLPDADALVPFSAKKSLNAARSYRTL
jgi:nitroreductase